MRLSDQLEKRLMLFLFVFRAPHDVQSKSGAGAKLPPILAIWEG